MLSNLNLDIYCNLLESNISNLSLVNLSFLKNFLPITQLIIAMLKLN